jgi:hypothetical protein
MVRDVRCLYESWRYIAALVSYLLRCPFHGANDVRQGNRIERRSQLFDLPPSPRDRRYLDAIVYVDFSIHTYDSRLRRLAGLHRCNGGRYLPIDRSTRATVCAKLSRKLNHPISPGLKGVTSVSSDMKNADCDRAM